MDPLGGTRAPRALLRANRSELYQFNRPAIPSAATNSNHQSWVDRRLCIYDVEGRLRQRISQKSFPDSYLLYVSNRFISVMRWVCTVSVGWMRRAVGSERVEVVKKTGDARLSDRVEVFFLFSFGLLALLVSNRSYSYRL